MADFKASRGQGEVSDPAAAGAKAGGPGKNKRRADNFGVKAPEKGGKFSLNNTVPGQPGTAELNPNMHEEIMAQLDEMSDAEIDELFEELTEGVDDEELEALLDELDADDDDEDEDEDEEFEEEDPFEDLPDQVREAFKITNADLDLAEFATAFEGQNLSEEFRTATKNIFESVLVKTFNDRLDVLAEAVAEFARESLQEKEEKMVLTLDRMLDDVIAEWLVDNEVAIESGIKTDIAENVIQNFRKMLAESGVAMSDEQIDVAQTLSLKNEELSEAVNSQYEYVQDLEAELDAFRKRDAILEVCDDLTEAQLHKVYSLVENIEYVNSDQFEKVVADIRENYFPKNGTPSASKSLTEDFVPTNGSSQKVSAHAPAVAATFAALGNAKK